MPQIGLGTVQLGLPYGVKASDGLIPNSEAQNILHQAVNLNIAFIDTAIAYGESETRIGAFLKKNKDICLDVSTKIPPVERSLWQNTELYFQYVNKLANESLNKLGIKKHRILQFHQCDLDFLVSKSVSDIFSRLIENNICSIIGVSVYTVEQAYAVLDLSNVKCLQVPINILDDRFITQDLISKYKKNNIYIISRSLFLQGILIRDVEIPDVNKKKELLELKNFCMNLNPDCDMQKLALDFIFNNKALEFIKVGLIGAHSAMELKKNHSLINSKPILMDNMLVINEIRNFCKEPNRKSIIDPSNWRI